MSRTWATLALLALAGALVVAPAAEAAGAPARGSAGSPFYASAASSGSGNWATQALSEAATGRVGGVPFGSELTTSEYSNLLGTYGTTGASALVQATAIKPSAWGILGGLTNYPPVSDASGVSQSSADSVLTRARVAAGRLPGIGSLISGGVSGSTGLKSGALGTAGLVLKSTLWGVGISVAVNGYLDLYHLLAGDYGTTGTSSAPVSSAHYRVAPEKWLAANAGDGLVIGDTGSTAVVPATGYYLRSKLCNDTTDTCTPTANADVLTCSVNPSLGSGGGDCNGGYANAMVTAAAGIGAGASFVQLTSYGGSATSNLWVLYAPETAIAAATTETPITGSVYTGLADKASPFAYTAPPASDALKQAAVGQYGDPSTQTADQAAAEAALGAAAAAVAAPLPAPVVAQVPPFILPRPDVGEAVSDYVERLRALGYTGPVNVVGDAMPYPDSTPAAEQKPGTVTEAAVDGLYASLYDAATGLPDAWPLDAPAVYTTPYQSVAPTAAIDVVTVPDAWDPTAHGAGSGLAFPAIHSPCDKFPFGLLCWWPEQLYTLFAAPAVCPSATYNATDLSTGFSSFPTIHIPEINISVCDLPASADAFILFMRVTLSFLVWFLGLWYFGSRILRLRGTPDIGEGGDDA